MSTSVGQPGYHSSRHCVTGDSVDARSIMSLEAGFFDVLVGKDSCTALASIGTTPGAEFWMSLSTVSGVVSCTASTGMRSSETFSLLATVDGAELCVLSGTTPRSKSGSIANDRMLIGDGRADYCDFQNVVYFRPICNSRIQRLQKKKLATFSHITATNTYLRGRQHAESTESNCFHKLTEENCTNNNNSPHIHCKNALPLAEFGTFSPVARHAAMLC